MSTLGEDQQGATRWVVQGWSTPCISPLLVWGSLRKGGRPLTKGAQGFFQECSEVTPYLSSQDKFGAKKKQMNKRKAKQK